MKTEKEIDKIVNGLYDYYGSGTGVLFGIPSDLRPSVRAIAKIILNLEEKSINRRQKNEQRILSNRSIS